MNGPNTPRRTRLPDPPAPEVGRVGPAVTTSSYAELPSGRTHYQDRGEGPAIILLHGSGRNHSDWNAVAAGLATNHRTIAVDLYGCGRSDRSNHYRYGYDLWCEQTIQLMDHLDVRHATIVGHSVGGIIACVAAARRPDRTRNVVTVGTGLAIDPMLAPLAIPGIGELILARRSTDNHTPTIEQRAERETAYRIPGTRAALLRYSRRQLFIDGPTLLCGAIDNLPVPTVHVSGELDRNIRPAATRRLARRTRGAVAPWPGANHYTLIYDPGWLVARIAAFTADIGPGKRGSSRNNSSWE